MPYSDMSRYLDDSVVIISKEEDRYKIVGVSTAAIRDKDGETFSVDAMDYDIAKAIELDDYPEFRLFHKQFLAIGKVTKMSRVGIFAIDEGYAYDDPFSKEVCDRLLLENDGRWRMSRGFYVVEATGGCPNCGSDLLVETKHMVTGFSCPQCKAIHLGYKGTLKDIEFRKTRTFDVTVTDIPCVPMTGVSAFKNSKEVSLMTKKELREKLLDAGLSPEVVDERLKEVDDERLKELDTLPQAKLLKELEVEEQDSVGNEELFVLDPEVLKDFADVVEKVVEPLVMKAVSEALEDIEIDLGDIEIKEFEGLEELKEQMAELKEAVDVLGQSEEERLKEVLEQSPRAGKLRIMRSKCNTKKAKPEEEEEEEEKMEEKEFDTSDGIIFGSDGVVAENMTAFVSAGGN